MSVFAVFTANDKSGTLHPAVVGPFPSEAAADAFVQQHPRWNGVCLEPVDGGYAGAVIVSAETATTPEAYAAA